MASSSSPVNLSLERVSIIHLEEEQEEPAVSYEGPLIDETESAMSARPDFQGSGGAVNLIVTNHEENRGLIFSLAVLSDNNGSKGWEAEQWEACVSGNIVDKVAAIHGPLVSLNVAVLLGNEFIGVGGAIRVA
uniref:Uncharacterized protein n=1 Tax=Cannabis sativa TaxID=3483 RepID=A0A803PCE7_CANSA